jgi:cytochrome c oxidase subunit IV
MVDSRSHPPTDSHPVALYLDLWNLLLILAGVLLVLVLAR